MAKAYHKDGPQRKGVERQHVADVKESAAAVSSIPKVEFALRAARRGMRVFPMLPNSAVTASAEAYCDPSMDEDQIRDWWSADPKQNIGIACVDLLVLHTTSTKAVDALGDLISAMLGETPKTTRTVICEGRKISDGYLIFSLPKGARVEEREILPGVRVLGEDDAILGPGSEIDELESIFANERSVAPAPAWLIQMCGVKPPEGIPVSNVIPMKKAASAPSATELAAPKTSPTKTKLDWALEAAQYIPVHPLRWYVDPGPNASPKEREDAVKAAKAALVFDWPNLATQDPEQIRKWWTQWPRANVGGATNDFIVVDIDPRNGGDDTFAGLLAVEYDFPETATTRSQSGGRHLIYVAPDGPVKGDTKGDVLGVGIDVKARGGYVVMPGSTIEGRMYTRENARPPAFAPQWIVERLKTARPKTAAAGKRVVEEDETAIEMATQWMLKHAPTAEYGAIDDTTYKVAARLYDFGVTEQTALEIMLEWNELRCSPPGDLDRLEVVVRSAGRNRENAIGSKHPGASGFDAVEIDESKKPIAAAAIPIATIGDAGTWENEPNAIFVDHLKPVDLPAGVLPELVEKFARDRARRLGVDAGAPAAALVTALGSLVPAGNRLQMRQLDTEWTVKPILWTAIIGPPGSNKSATINAAMGPVQKVQSGWRKSFAANEHKRKLNETRRAAAEKANKAKPENTDEVFEGEAEAAKPRFRQKIYNDATTEALAVGLCENPEGVLYHADELAGWLAGMDAYRAKGGKDRAFWLQAKEGGDYTVNRKLSDRIYVENCAISVLGGIQPDKIKALKLGMSDDGLLQRFTPINVHRSGNGADIAPDLATGERLLSAANAIAEAANGTLFRFSPEADAELHAIEAFKAREIARPDASPTLCQWLDKMPNEFGRLSLVFHFVEHYGASGAAVGTPPAAIISRATAGRARRYLTEFVYSHALTFYLKDLGASTMDEHALWIAGFVLARGLPAISSRDIYRVYPALKSPEKRSLIVATMRVLEMHDWVKPAHIDRHGAEDQWTVNPAVHDGRFAEVAATERRRRDGVQERIKQGAAA